MKDVQVTIQPYMPHHAQAFSDINKYWIKQYFKLEPLDLCVLDNPDQYIVKRGGTILMADHGKFSVGTIALIPINESVTELSKMRVMTAYQGRGLGGQLIDTALLAARNQNYKEVVLYTNSVLKPAIHLYYKKGFKLVELEEDSLYARSDIKMSITL